MTSPGKATREDLESVGWDYLFTADTHHSADYGDMSSGHPPPSSCTKLYANEVQYKGHLESGLVQEMMEEQYTLKTLHNDLIWKTPQAGTSHTNFKSSCHGGWFTSNVTSFPSDVTFRLPPPHWMPSEQTPPQALSASFFTNHTEETRHEDLDVSELVDEVIKDVNTDNRELNHQPFTASTDQLSHDRYGEAEWATSLPLDTSTHSMFKYQDFTPANEANYQTEDTHNVEQVSRYDVELDMCSQNCWNRQMEVQTTFEDLQHPVEMEVFNRAPYSYNNREEESLGDEDDVANGKDDCGQYAKNITDDEKLFDDYEWNMDEATNKGKKTDDDKEMDKDETNEDKTEETNQDKCTDDEDGRTDEYYNVVGEETGHEDTDEEIDEEVTEDEEFEDDDDDEEEEEDFDTEFEADEEFDDNEDFNTEIEGDEEFDIDTSSEFSVGEVDVDTDASSSHRGYYFSDQAITCSHGCKDILVLAYLTSTGSSQATSEEMKDYSVEQFPNTIATDADEALCTIIEEDECSVHNRSKESITSSTFL